MIMNSGLPPKGKNSFNPTIEVLVDIKSLY